MKTVIPGKQIKTLDQLNKCEFIIIHGRNYHFGWFTSWTLRTAAGYIASGKVYEGIKVTKANKGDK